MTTTKRTRKPQPLLAHLQQRGDNLILWLAVGNDADAYLVTSIANQFGRAAYHLHKAFDGKNASEEYDVLIDGQNSQCDCKSFSYRGMNTKDKKGCKHVVALTAALDAGRLQPAPKPQPASVVEQFNDYDDP